MESTDSGSDATQQQSSPDSATTVARDEGDYVDAVVTVPTALLPSFYEAVGEWWASQVDSEEKYRGKTRL